MILIIVDFFQFFNAISRSRAAQEKTEERWNLFEPLKVASFAAPGFSKQHREVPHLCGTK
jgi:hypothetical protein